MNKECFKYFVGNFFKTISVWLKATTDRASIHKTELGDGNNEFC